MKTCIYKNLDGSPPILADVYPAGTADRSPVVVWLHGGALIFGGRQWMHPVLRGLFAGKGWSQISIDYRLAPETKLPEIINDIRDAFRWIFEDARKEFRLDTDRVAVIGHSAGGYLALMCGFCLQQKIRALVSFYGYGDLIGDWYTRPSEFYGRQPAVSREHALSVVGERNISNGFGKDERFDFYLWCRQNGRWPIEAAGLDPIRDADAFRPYVPVQNVSAGYPPTLLFHGTADDDVPYEQSVLMADALRDSGITHELVTIPDAGHLFDNDITEADLSDEAADSRGYPLLKTTSFLETAFS